MLRRPATLTAVLIACIAVVALGVRAVTVRADLPYTTYAAEQFTLKGSAHQIADTTWDPAWYGYPSFLMNATTLSASAVAVTRGETGELRDGARTTIESRYVEVVEPSILVLAGRLVVLILSSLTVVFVALLGIRLAGRRVGLLAALMVAVLPMFVSRGSIVIVDTPATCFVVAALYCASRLADRATRAVPHHMGGARRRRKRTRVHLEVHGRYRAHRRVRRGPDAAGHDLETPRTAAGLELRRIRAYGRRGHARARRPSRWGHRRAPHPGARLQPLQGDALVHASAPHGP